MKLSLKMNLNKKIKLRDLLIGVDGELFHLTLNSGKEDHQDFMIELSIPEKTLNLKTGPKPEFNHDYLKNF